MLPEARKLLNRASVLLEDEHLRREDFEVLFIYRVLHYHVCCAVDGSKLRVACAGCAAQRPDGNDSLQQRRDRNRW